MDTAHPTNIPVSVPCHHDWVISAHIAKLANQQVDQELAPGNNHMPLHTTVLNGQLVQHRLRPTLGVTMCHHGVGGERQHAQRTVDWRRTKGLRAMARPEVVALSANDTSPEATPGVAMPLPAPSPPSNHCSAARDTARGSEDPDRAGDRADAITRSVVGVARAGGGAGSADDGVCAVVGLLAPTGSAMWLDLLVVGVVPSPCECWW